MTDRELMQIALDALEEIPFMSNRDDYENVSRVITTLRARLAQPEPEELGEVVPADEDQLKRIAKLVEQEPVAWGFQNTGITGSNRWMYLRETIPAEDQYRGVLWTPLYTAPPQREWQGLTDEEAMEIEDRYPDKRWAIIQTEAKLKEKNG